MTRRSLLWIGLALVSLVMTAAAAFNAGRHGAATALPPTEADADAGSSAASGATDRVQLTPGAMLDAGVVVTNVKTLPLSGGFEANAVMALDETRTTRIGSMFEGTIMRILVEVGDRVQQGSLLAELHSHEVHDAMANFRRAVAERRKLESELAFAVDAEQRAVRLLVSKAVSEQDLERAVVNRKSAEQQLEMARAEVVRGEEHLEHLGITNGEDPGGQRHEQIPSKSPIAGVVLERLVTTGTAVNPGAPLFVVSDLSALWALAEVDERRLGDVVSGSPIGVRVSAFGDRVFPGTVGFVADAVNPTTRRVVIRGRVPNPDGLLKPGMFATMQISTGGERMGLAVPSKAVQDVAGQQVVFVEEQPGVFVRRRVETGVESGEWIEITWGLRPEDRVVVQGAFLLKGELLSASAPEES
ncbi:MAG: efflux RND transporter periplasmic adaptor subunit [Vicinamibacterales bacterium]